MNTQHTPGPWYNIADPLFAGKHPYHDNRLIATRFETVVIRDRWDNPVEWEFMDPSGSIIARLTDHEEQAANARLIAASPELLAALEDVLERVSMEENFDETIPIYARAKAAIAKARGGKS